MKTLVFVLMMFLSAICLASGIITLDGKFYGKTDKVFMVQRNDQIFSIEKSKIPQNQVKYLSALHWQDNVAISVAMDAIKDVHDKK